MTFESDQVYVLKRFVGLEFKATLTLIIRAIPSFVIWGGLFVWFFR